MEVETFESLHRGTRVSLTIGYHEHMMGVTEAIDLAGKISGALSRPADEPPDNGRLVLIKVWSERVICADGPDGERTEEFLSWRVGYYDDHPPSGWWDARNGTRAKPLAWCEIIVPPI